MTLSSNQAQLDEALDRLREAEAARAEAVEELIELGVIRSRSHVVGELGETFAARYYGVDLAPPSTPGFDLETRDGRNVQVRTLRSSPWNKRSVMGVIRQPYDVLLAVELGEDYRPVDAYEIPREVLNRHFPRPGSRAVLTKGLKGDPGARRIEAAVFLTEGAGRNR